MSNMINIAALGIKPTPVTSQREGITINLYALSTVANKPDEESQLPDIEKTKDGTTVEVIDKPITSKTLIVDARRTHDVDRKSILRNMTARGIERVSNKKLPPQATILEESEIDSIIPPSETILFEISKKGTGKIHKPGKKVVIKRSKKSLPSVKAAIDELEEEIVDSSDEEAIDKSKKEKVESSDEDVIDKLEEDVDFFKFEKRMPSSVVEHRLKTSNFYMNNRKKFISQLMPLFSKYKRELSDEDKKASCDDTNSKKGEAREFKLMTHQKVVSDYLNLYTPYRGLLLYHGLGSGKTCTSIAITEGMKSQKKIIVLTLASLKANFFNQMKECGDPIYKLDQFWEFISTAGQPNYIQLLSKILSLPEEYVRKHKGAWMVNIKKESNFNDLDDDDKKSLNQQLDEMIRSKYIHYNYNGLNQNIMNRMTDNLKKNPFDNCVVVIDEVHNFVSRIVNKMSEKTSISYKLYEYLMSAANARIVL